MSFTPKLLYVDPYDKRKRITEYPELIHVIGGDGTLLTAINEFYDLKKPFYGIAGGTVNFLMNEKGSAVEDPTIMTMPIMKAVVTQTSGKQHTIYAFNDFDIGSHRGWITFDCEHKDNQVGSFKGAGIVVSTAAGSTGTNKNNGGPILALDSQRWAVTSTTANRRISTVLRPTELVITCTARKPVTIGADGDNVVINNIKSVAITTGGSVKVIINDLESLQKKRQ